MVDLHRPWTRCMLCGKTVIDHPDWERWLVLYDAGPDEFVNPDDGPIPASAVYGRLCNGCLLVVPRRLRILESRNERNP